MAEIDRPSAFRAPEIAQDGVTTPWALFRDRASYYQHYAGWMARDILGHTRGGIIRLLITGFVAVGGRVLTFGLLFVLLRALSSGEPARFRGWFAVPAPDSILAASGWGLALALAAAITASTRYWELRSRIDLGEAYARSLIRRVFASVAELSRLGVDVPSLTETKRLLAGAGLVVRIVQPLLAPLVPLLTALVAVAAMIALDPGLTAVIGLLAIPSFPTFYQLNRRVLRASRNRDANRKELARDTGMAVASIQAPQTTQPDSLANEFLELPSMQVQMAGFRDLLLNRGRVTAWNNALFGAALVAILLITSVRSTGSGALPDVLVYAVLVRMSFGAVQHLTTSVSSFTRFLPQYQRYVDVLMAADNSTQRRSRTTLPAMEGTVRPKPTDVLLGLDDPVNLLGSVSLLLVPDATDWAHVAHAWVERLGQPIGAQYYFITGRTPPPSDKRLDTLSARLLDPSGMSDRQQELRGLLERLDPQLRPLIMAADSDCKVLITERRLWARCPSALRDALLKDLRTVVLTSAVPATQLPREVDFAVDIRRMDRRVFMSVEAYDTEFNTKSTILGVPRFSEDPFVGEDFIDEDEDEEF